MSSWSSSEARLQKWFTPGGMPIELQAMFMGVIDDFRAIAPWSALSDFLEECGEYPRTLAAVRKVIQVCFSEDPSEDDEPNMFGRIQGGSGLLTFAENCCRLACFEVNPPKIVHLELKQSVQKQFNEHIIPNLVSGRQWFRGYEDYHAGMMDVDYFRGQFYSLQEAEQYTLESLGFCPTGEELLTLADHFDVKIHEGDLQKIMSVPEAIDFVMLDPLSAEINAYAECVIRTWEES